MKINKYPDGTSYINDVEDLHESVFRINTYEDLWHLNQAIDAYKHKHNNNPTITIPNLIDAQADRRFNDGESSGLKLVCKFLNNLDANFKIFHPHNPEVVESLMDNVEIIDNSFFIITVLDSLLLDTNNHESLILMSPDAGSFKPLMGLCDKIGWKGETFSGSKARSYIGDSMTLVQQIDRTDFKGKDILIIDDLSVYGGTFKGLSKMLKERNCGKLYLAVSHMTVQDLGKDPVTNYFDKVFTTNSKFDKYPQTHLNYLDTGYNENPDNLTILKMF